MHADWIDLFALLEKHGVRYLVIGGNAVAYYGYERFTKDIDIWVSPDADNAQRVHAACTDHGAIATAIKPEDFMVADNFVVIGVEPYRVDILMGPPGLDFEIAYADRVVDSRSDVHVNYISRDHLIVLKKAADRFVDRRDVQMREAGRRLEEGVQNDDL